jgi:voltage-gated potassium channel
VTLINALSGSAHGVPAAGSYQRPLCLPLRFHVLKPVSKQRTPQQEQELRRWALLRRVESWLEQPMIVLGFLWLLLLLIELLLGVGPWLQRLITGIWIVFIFDFLLRLLLAPRKGRYLGRNWLTMIALLVPALRMFRFARLLPLLRATRSVRLIRLVTSLNRSMRALGKSMRRRGFAYVMVLSVLVLLAGAAGVYTFENLPGGRGIDSYWEALWWTAMIMTTMGSDYWPQTAEGRVLCLLLALYAFAVFGYVTATLASFFIDQDAADAQATVAGEPSLRALREEIAALRHELQQSRRSGASSGDGEH